VPGTGVKVQAIQGSFRPSPALLWLIAID